MRRRYTAQPCDDENGRTWDVVDGCIVAVASGIKSRVVASGIKSRVIARVKADEYEIAWRVVLAFGVLARVGS